MSVSDDGAALVEDPDGLIDVRLGQYSLRQGRTVYFDQEPEEWARSLIATFNAPDLAPDVLADTNPWAVAETEDLAPRLAEGATTADDVPVAAAAEAAAVGA